jgi:hypothetical protein
MEDSFWDNGRPGSNMAGVEGEERPAPSPAQGTAPQGNKVYLGREIIGGTNLRAYIY